MNHYVIYIICYILECEVKRALENITVRKASGGDRIPVELFQILKHDDFYTSVNQVSALTHSGHSIRTE